jgi:ABC-type Fe3+/spermidine/putrescine transport system ATPase subunit
MKSIKIDGKFSAEEEKSTAGMNGFSQVLGKIVMLPIFDPEARFQVGTDGKKLYIGTEAVLDAAGISDQEVYAAIRPEGFELKENGSFTCHLNAIEVMGRDISVVCKHEKCENVAIRAIIDAENVVDTSKDTVQFKLKPNKVFLFRKDTQLRIHI